MIDLHCHIVPGVDDGAADLPMALDMARDAVATGCEAVFATSHLWERLFDTSPEVNRAEWEHLVVAVKDEGIPLEIYPAAENYLASNVAPEQFAEQAVPLGEDGRYVLFDFSLRRCPKHVPATIAALAKVGRTAVIAHPERNADLQEDPRPIAEWIAHGALIQVNSPSLLGIHGETAAAVGAELLSCGAAHLLASDAHDRRRRPFSLDRGREAAAKIVGEEEADALTRIRPAMIARNETIEVPRQVEINRGRGPGFLRKLFEV